MKQRLLKLLKQYRVLIFVLVFAGLCGYCLLKLQIITNPQADPDYIKSKQEISQTDSIRVKDSLEEEINKLTDTPVNVQPSALGRPDPFNP
jgi:hypothetical protein